MNYHEQDSYIQLKRYYRANLSQLRGHQLTQQSISFAQQGFCDQLLAFHKLLTSKALTDTADEKFTSISKQEIIVIS